MWNVNGFVGVRCGSMLMLEPRVYPCAPPYTAKTILHFQSPSPLTRNESRDSFAPFWSSESRLCARQAWSIFIDLIDNLSHLSLVSLKFVIFVKFVVFVNYVVCVIIRTRYIQRVANVCRSNCLRAFIANRRLIVESQSVAARRGVCSHFVRVCNGISTFFYIAISYFSI